MKAAARGAYGNWGSACPTGVMAQAGLTKRRNHKLRALLANMSEGLLAVDSSGVVRLMNEAAERLLGRERSAVVDKPLEEIGDATLIGEIQAILAASRAKPRDVTLSKDGRVLAVSVNPYRVGKEKGVAVVLRDDTELVRQQERWEAVLASTGDGLVVFAPDNRVTYVNPSACEMLGVAASEVTGTRRTMSELLGVEPAGGPSDAVPCWELKACTEKGCPAYHAAELRCWLLSGTLCEGCEGYTFEDKVHACFMCEVYLRNSRYLEEAGMSVVKEITISEPAQRILKLKTNPVIDSSGAYVGCVTSLHDVTAEREINQMKNEFVSTVSHELRTPLTSIKGYVDLILDGEAGEINEIQQEFLTIVKQNSDRLVALINDLLDISRIESGRIHLKIQPLDISEIVQGAVETFRTVAETAGIKLNMKLAKSAQLAAGDRDRVGQVVMNLLSNAIKYSPGGGTVTVQTRRRDGQVAVSVTDEGIGISTEDQEHLFEKFYRVDSSLTREIGGSGLGLSICKTIIELLGGQIWVKSTPGKGSTFSFSLPVAPPELVRTPGVEGPAVVARGTKVLVVDPEPEVARLIEIYLTKQGYRVIQAHSARQALQLAREEKPRVVTLDVMLEDADGFELLQQLKSLPEMADVPIVVLSVICDERRSWRLGAANYLEKPIDQEQLVSVVNGLVGSIESPLVLVVDDDRPIVRALSDTLKAKGFAVAAAYDGLEAMAAVKRQRPDLVLLDLRMPNMDGYQVIKALRRSKETSDIPIVVMTAYHLDYEKTDVLAMTAAQIHKPFEVEQLAERVKAVLLREERGP